MTRPTHRRPILDGRIRTGSLRHRPIGNQALRHFEAAGAVWWVVSDICRAYGLRSRPEGPINVTWAVRGLPGDSVVLAAVEIEPGTLKPFSKILCIREDAVGLMLEHHGRSADFPGSAPD